MVSTLIYRSTAGHRFSEAEIQKLAGKAFTSNLRLNVTGILLFDGDHFLQVLEGPEVAIETVLRKLRQDPRHYNITTLLRSSEARRRFGSWGMYLADVSDRESKDAIRWMPKYHYLHEEDRVVQIIEHFVRGYWKTQNGNRPLLSADDWVLRDVPFPLAHQAPFTSQLPYSFAFQPILDVEKSRVSSVEALVRGIDGGPPQQVFAPFGNDPVALYGFDLRSKATAIQMAAALGCRCDLSVNLLPGSLTQVRDSTDFLLRALSEFGISPEQLVVEITEEEVIANHDEFRAAAQKLRAAGIRIAIDDFGAGYAGLAILSEFQPDKLKIDRRLVTNISTHGPKQAIVSAIIDICRPLGMMVVAEGIETIDEFRWLKNAGVQRFQGFLFAKPQGGDFGSIAMPVKAQSEQAV